MNKEITVYQRGRFREDSNIKLSDLNTYDVAHVDLISDSKLTLGIYPWGFCIYDMVGFIITNPLPDYIEATKNRKTSSITSKKNLGKLRADSEWVCVNVYNKDVPLPIGPWNA